MGFHYGNTKTDILLRKSYSHDKSISKATKDLSPTQIDDPRKLGVIGNSSLHAAPQQAAVVLYL
jgi:hypothetical protein